jgi:hypothetical protein
MEYSGAWRKLIHEKKTEVENLVALSLQDVANLRGDSIELWCIQGTPVPPLSHINGYNHLNTPLPPSNSDHLIRNQCQAY